MAKLIVGLNKAKRRVAVCDNCNNQIYAPTSNVVYAYCYCCGAKFEQEYDARDIKKLCETPKEWNDNWREELKKNRPSCYDRLCNCNNTKRDLIIIARYIYSYNFKNHTREECLDRAVTWLTSWNNQVELIPNNYNWYLERI